MNKKMHIHYDANGDFLEIRFGKPKPSYYDDLGDDTFVRMDEQTNKVIGYAFFNVKKRKESASQDIEVDLSSIAIS